MPKKLILLGDPTSHGGVVISGSPNDTIDGKPIARLGDLVSCPQHYPDKRPHGINKIIEGDADWTIEGVPVAMEGQRTECGCTLMGTGSSSVG